MLNPHRPARISDDCGPATGGGFPFSGEESTTQLGVMSGLGDGRLPLGMSVRGLAIVLLPIALVGCAGSEDSRSISFTDDRGVSEQPYPDNYRPEILAFMRTY